MSCCTYKCEQGRDCPIRKQNIEDINKAFVERGRVVDPDPYVETVGTVKALIAFIVVVVGITLLAFAIWGK